MDYFKNRKALLVTKHRKEEVIAPLFKKEINLIVETKSNLNTDKFGTFTREVKRKKDQIQTALAKAYWGIKNTEYKIGIASEGSFSPSPIPFLNGNLEIVVLVDKKNNLEIIGENYTLETNIKDKKITSIKDALKVAKDWDFPNHGIIVRKHKNLNFFIDKDLNNLTQLKHSVKKYLNWPIFKFAYLETDMRADRNPTRMKAIGEATKDLIKNIKNLCPKCDSPGFSISEKTTGLPCNICRKSTSQIKSHKYKCQKCKFEKIINVKDEFADAKYCKYCNQ